MNDTAELFMRASKLLDLAGRSPTPRPRPHPVPPEPPGSLQPLVRNLLETLLEDYPTLLDEMELDNLMDEHFCRHELGLQISNFPLLRREAAGRKGPDGRERYYQRLYAGRFYVCSQWWRAHHLSNAESLLQFVNGLVQRKQDHPEIPVLDNIRRRLQEYVG